jgi:hypothetical protein
MVREESRRLFLQKIGVLTGVISIPGVAKAHGDDSALEQLRVQGTNRIQVKYRPDSIEVTERRQSPDLARRYDINPPVLETTEELDRERADEDVLPERGVDTFEEDWDTYLGTEAEWRDHHQTKHKEDNTVSTQTGHGSEEDNSDYAYWIYRETSCNYSCIGDYYEVTSPINVIFWLGSSSETLSDVSDTLTSDPDWSSYAAEYTRYAWDRNANNGHGRFMRQQATAATAPFGWDVQRNHVRCWEFGEYVSMQAHIDTEVPHSVDSYIDAEREIDDLFDQAGWTVYQDFYGLNNSRGDHNGSATWITPP